MNNDANYCSQGGDGVADDTNVIVPSGSQWHSSQLVQHSVNGQRSVQLVQREVRTCSL